MPNPPDKLDLSVLLLEPSYRTGQSDPVAEFYQPCLLKACAYDRAVGYFRSSIYLIVGAATIEFARQGGKIRLICSPALYEDDATSIEEGYAQREQLLAQSISHDIDEMMSAPSSEYRTRILATLVAVGAMDIRLALLPNETGIYHEKLGVFRDSTAHAVSFVGSANESWSAWHEQGNFESIEVFCSWKNQSDEERVRRHEVNFGLLWNGRMPGVQVVPFPEASRSRLVSYAHRSIEEIDTSGFELGPQTRTPYPHQTLAIDTWEQRGRRGILEHATGSGKTFTAMMALKKHLSLGMPALILVPSRLLLDQWASEIRINLPRATLLLAGAGNDSWKTGNRLQSMSSNGTDLGERVIIATMQTAARKPFRSRLSQGSHLMVVADEVHQIGSEFNSQALEVITGPRLGLSATPSRFGDPVGTARISDYFGEIVPPKFTLQDAIKAGRLAEYEYHAHPVHLAPHEAQEWRERSTRIRLEIARCREDDDGRKLVSERAKMMLIERSRIAKKATNKIQVAADTLNSCYREGQRWLVYCEDGDQLRDVMNALKESGHRPMEYHSSMEGDRQATLDWFKKVGGIVVSIKCLDEGVDIPAVDHAMILASSQNPRQFIQRRGRVLRQSSGKAVAVIHDAIVVPVSLEDEPDQFGLLKSELLRAIEFAKSAFNRFAGAELRSIAGHLGIDPDSQGIDGIEEEE